jgi:hypothetical protein
MYDPVRFDGRLDPRIAPRPPLDRRGRPRRPGGVYSGSQVSASFRFGAGHASFADLAGRAITGAFSC